MASDVPVVDLRRSPKEVKEFCETNSEWSMQLDESWTAEEIGVLYRTHIGVPEPNTDVIGEIGNDPRSPEWVLSDIVEGFWADRILMVGVAVNPAAPPQLLERLAQHDQDEVRRKAERNLNDRTAPS